MGADMMAGKGVDTVIRMVVDTVVRTVVDTDVIMATCKIASIDTEVNIRGNSKESMNAKVKVMTCINPEAKENVSIDLRVTTSKEANIWMATKRSLRQCLTNSLANMIRKDVNTEAKENAVTLKTKTRRLDP